MHNECCQYWPTCWKNLFKKKIGQVVGPNYSLPTTWLDPIPSIEQTVEDAAFSSILLSCVCLRLLPPILSILEFSERDETNSLQWLPSRAFVLFLHYVCIILSQQKKIPKLNGDLFRTSFFTSRLYQTSIRVKRNSISTNFSSPKFFTIILHSTIHFKLLVQYDKNGEKRFCLSKCQPKIDQSLWFKF